GGPVVRDGVVVGVSMQMLEQAENVGYMVPAPVVRHFLDDVADGKVDGLPELGAQLQPLESPALRSSLGLEGRRGGALVARVAFGSAAHGVLVSIGGYQVAGDLTVAMPRIGRVSLDAVIGAQQVGTKLAMSILRSGQAREVEVTLAGSVALVPGRRAGEVPEYFLFGGAVFQPLTGEYFELYDELPPELAPFSDPKAVVTAERRQVVILSAVLPDPVARGYLGWESVVVRSVDGAAPRDLAHLAELVDAASGPYLRVETEGGLVMVLDVNAARDSARRILAKYGIAHDRSANLRRPAP
ncbi:MAG: PDZ domain-containing protein, partial [Candidatus Binatia bacterium]